MSHRIVLVLLGCLAFLPFAGAGAQPHHHAATVAKDYDDPVGGDPDPPANCEGVPAKVTISGGSVSFSPASVTIRPGEKVCWTWQTSIPHNVRGDAGSFGSGDAATSGTFQVTFRNAGTYGYHCQVHGSTGGGMRGTVVVTSGDNGGGGTGPGKLQVAATAVTVEEGAGFVTLEIQRVEGSDGTAAVSYTTGNGSAKVNKDYSRARGQLLWEHGDAAPKLVQVPIKNDSSREPDETFTLKLSKAAGASLLTSTATVTIHDDDTPGCGAASLAPPAALRARGGSADEIRLTWGEEPAAASAVHVERRPPGGEFAHVATVTAGIGSFEDRGLPAGSVFHYRLRSAAPEGLSGYSDVAAAATDGAAAACGDGELCLHDGRFAAAVAWGEPAGERGGDGAPIAGGRAGLFARRLGEPELLLAVSDGCAENDHFGVALAALAERELTVTVRDTESGRTWAHYAPAGSQAAVRDADALATCP